MTTQKTKAARELGSDGAASKNYCTNNRQIPVIPQDIESGFLNFMRAAGLAPVKDQPVADGRLRRYRVEGDSPGSKNGWYVLRLDPSPHGAAGSWKTGETHHWRDTDSRPATARDDWAMRQRMRAINEQRWREQQAVWDQASTKAARLWSAARPANPNHPYLRAKRVRPHGIRQLRAQLVIPVRRAGELFSIQFIGPDGTKKFLTGGKVRGCYHAIGRPGNLLYIAEGYATAATVFEVTGQAVAVAFNAGNLADVARFMRSKFEAAKIVVVADDDHATPGNPGLTAATQAARMIGGFVARPDFSGVRTA